MRPLHTLMSTLCISLAATSALADKGSSCHFHGNKPAAEPVVIGCADARRATLIKAGKLDPSWAAIKHEKIEQVDGKKGREWKLTYKNPAAPDKNKQSLYLFFTAPGNFVAGNHTGP